ncbi:hypothetical protein P5704_027160 (plasmid) [Pseudomonas sp. FeN3W]|nr:hypothetical protein P5704_027160 [Pseudomonas sp. FeN3W]
MADVYSNDPVIKVEKRTFAVTQRAGDELVINRFEKEVVTLREVIASFSLLHRGVVIKELSSYCDTTGYMSAIESAACDIPGLLEAYRISPEDTLVLALRLSISDALYLPTGVAEQYNQVPNDWYLSCPPYESESATWLGQNGLMLNEPTVIMDKEIIWISQLRLDVLKNLRKQYMDLYPINLGQ